MIPISVCMPVYNRAECIRECIDSILLQTFNDFELLIVDDGSTDETCDIIKSYNDPRIRLIQNKHDYIHSCNLLFEEAKGKYIARMDSDDIMMPDRLQIQYDYMENHPEVDILGGSILFIEDGKETPFCKRKGNIKIEELLQGSCIVHPSVMMRASQIKKHNLKYDVNYIYAEDYHFWFQALKAGLCIRNLSDIFIKYRASKEQVTSVYYYEQRKNAKRISEEISRWISRSEEKWAIENSVIVPDTNNKLTLIIPFLNEKDEVAKTVQSVRYFVKDKVDIIVINDQSNDSYNYREELSSYNITYIYNIERKGVAASRDYGISICKTPYFLLLDAHMRFYDAKWVDKIVDLLEKDDRRLLCCQTRFLEKDDNGSVYLNKKCPKTFGAYILSDKEHYYPTVTWKYSESSPNENIEQIPIVLGAGYATSKRYWERIKGLKGLMCYGCDEVYMSLKVWMEGGKCLLLKDIEIGHIYRKRSPYKRYSEEEVYNHLLISYLLFPQSLYCMSNAIALHKDRITYHAATALFNEQINNIEQLKNDYKQIITCPFKSVIKMHQQELGVNKDILDRTLSRLEDIAQYLSSYQTSDYGLYEGQAGMMIWFCHYTQYTNNIIGDNKASELLDNIQEEIFSNKLSWNFKYGMCGIGWAILYLYANRILEDSPEDIINSIDDKIQLLDANLFSDYSLDTGLGGLYAYVSLRLKVDIPITWNNTFLKRLDVSATELLKKKTDISSYYYTMKYIMIRRKGIDKEDPLPSVNEWLNVSLFIPANINLWKISLADGCIGASLIAMLIKTHLNKKDYE